MRCEVSEVKLIANISIWKIIKSNVCSILIMKYCDIFFNTHYKLQIHSNDYPAIILPCGVIVTIVNWRSLVFVFSEDSVEFLPVVTVTSISISPNYGDKLSEVAISQYSSQGIPSYHHCHQPLQPCWWGGLQLALKTIASSWECVFYEICILFPMHDATTTKNR